MNTLAALRRHKQGLASMMALLVVTSTVPQRISAATGTWTLNNNGNWTDTPANWAGGIVPNAVGDIAIFRNDITAGRTVTLDQPVTLGGLQVNDALAGSGFTFAGTNALTLDNGASSAFISKFGSATDVWQAPLILNSTTNFNIHTGTFQVNGISNAPVPVSGAGNIVKNGAGALQLNSDFAGFSGNFVLNLGTLALGGAASGSPLLGSGTGAIVVNGSGSLGRTVLQLRNNGTGSNGLILINKSVAIQGAAQLNVDQNVVGGAGSGNVVSISGLDMNGGFLQTTGGNGYTLRVDGVTNLLGQTTAFFPNSAQLTLAGPILDGGAGRNLVKDDTGRLVISNPGNNYGGVTAVRNGILQLGPSANLGAGATFVNGGALVPRDKASLDLLSTGGLVLVGQLGTSRFALPAIGIAPTYGTIDMSNNVPVNVPVAGLALAIDSLAGNVTSNIDLSQVGNTGGGNRVWLTNILGADRTFQGTLLPSQDGNLRLSSAGSALIVSGDPNRLGGAGSTAGLIFGYDHANPMSFNGSQVIQAANGTVSIRTNNDVTLGPVTVNRGVTLNINGTGVTTPLGAGTVTALGGSISTDDTTDVRFGNSNFQLFGGSSLLLDNKGVASPNLNRRLQSTSQVSLSSSTLRLIGDGGASVESEQNLDTLRYAGGSTLSIDTDGTAAGRRTTLGVANLTRVGNGTLMLRNLSNTATTFGTASATQRLLITNAPTVTNGMIGANIALWGGANMADSGQPQFVTYDVTNGVQAAAFTATATPAALAAATSDQIADINGTALAVTGTPSVQALRIRSTANTHTVTGGTITLGATAGAGQGAGLFLAHTADNTVVHSTNFNFGAQEGLMYVGTPGGGSSIVNLSGVLAGSNGITRFGEGILALTGQNTFSGPLSLQSGETRLSQGGAGLPTDLVAKDINLWGGSLYLATSAARYQSNLVFRDDARIGNLNVGSAGFNNLVVEPRVGSSAPTVVRVQNQAGTNATTAYGSLVLNNNAQLTIQHVLQVNGGITGTGNLEKFFNERLVMTGASPGYAGRITSYAGGMTSLANGTVSLPFGTGNVVMQPGAAITLGAPNHLANGQLTINSDHGGISGIGMLYVADPLT